MFNYCPFQSTLPVWGATLLRGSGHRLGIISIHAPRVGSDAGGIFCRLVIGIISIHAPRVGSDGLYNEQTGLIDAFQSTLPVWGATASTQCPHTEPERFQSTLPVWGATTTS